MLIFSSIMYHTLHISMITDHRQMVIHEYMRHVITELSDWETLPIQRVRALKYDVIRQREFLLTGIRLLQHMVITNTIV
jgi:hypothetical protein